MIPLVDLPIIVEHYAPYFQDVFSPAALIEFERYISGLIVSENRTVDGINRLFVLDSRNQSSLNRLLTESPFSLAALNTARLQILSDLPATHLKPKGVLSVDDTLLTHFGEHFEQITKLFDPVTDSYVQAHDLVTLHYSDDQTDYPLRFQLWKPVDVAALEAGLREAQVPMQAKKQALKQTHPDKWRGYLLGVWQRRHSAYPQLERIYQSKLLIAQGLLTAWVQDHPQADHPVTFDTWYTQPAFCRYIDQTLHHAYVGSLAESEVVQLHRGPLSLADFATQLQQEQQTLASGGQPVFHKIAIPFKGTQETYYCYCNTHQVANFGKQRLVISYRQADLSDRPHFYISNRLMWQAAGITRIRRHRWPVEVYHEEGKAEGLDQYQLREFAAIEKHVALVAVVYSLLRAAPHDPVLRELLQRQLQVQLEDSATFWRRASQAQALWGLGLLISAGLAQGHSLPAVLSPLIHAMCRS